MIPPAILISFFGLTLVGGGIVAYAESASIASLVAGGMPGLGLLAGGIGVLKRKEFWLVFAPFLTLLLTLLFICHLVVSGDFIPAGLMGSLGFVALVVFYRALPSKETL